MPSGWAAYESGLVLFMPFYVLSMLLCAKALVDGIRGSDYRWVKTPRRPAGAEPEGAA